MKIIQSNCGKYLILVDDDQYDMLMEFAPNGWEAKYTTGSNSPYAITRKTITVNDRRVRKQYYMHRIVMGVLDDPSKHVDHVRSGDTLNNQRSNLRLVTRVENMKNRSSSKSSHSQYLGVSYCLSKKGWKRYRANIQDLRYRKGNIHLGYHYDETSAAYAYNLAAERIHGQYANLNRIDMMKVRNPHEIGEYIDGVFERYNIPIEGTNNTTGRHIPE